MDLNALFASTKWDILKLVAKEPQNPLKLAEKLGTSIANISQQLRLLEVAGLVKKEKVPNRERGKPRTLYSLSDEKFYLVILSKDMQKKKLFTLTDPLKGVVNQWFEAEGS